METIIEAALSKGKGMGIRGKIGMPGKRRVGTKTVAGQSGSGSRNKGVEAEALIEELLGFLDAAMLLHGRLSVHPRRKPERTRKRTLGYYE
jgi:hypothetical protein